jgi:superfamily II DNA or RNA helicase
MNNMKNKNTQPNKEKKDSGVGYDEKTKRYYTIVYIWEYIVDGLNKRLPYRDLKPGITGKSVQNAIAADMRKRMYVINPIWSDRYYLPKGITKDEAHKIVKKMDDDFKSEVEKRRWDKRQLLNTKQLGTEPLRVPNKFGSDFLKSLWREKYENSVNYHHYIVELKKIGFDYVNYDIPEVFLDVYEAIKEFFTIEQKGRFNAETGFGKTMILFLAGFITPKGQRSKIKIFVSCNIPVTKQVAKEHHERWDNGSYRRLVVCSNHTPIHTDFGDIPVYSWDDGALEQILTQTLIQDDELSIYVNRHSTYGFCSKLNELIKNTNYKREIFVGLDEIQKLTGDKTHRHLGIITNPIINSWQIGVTAGESHSHKDDKIGIIKNDSITHFGKTIPLVINTYEAQKRKRNSKLRFLHILWNGKDEFNEAILNNNMMTLKLNKFKDENIRASMLNTMIAIHYAITQKEKHIGICSLSLTGCQEIVDLCNSMIEEKIWPKFEVINGESKKRDKAKELANKLGEKNKPYIFVGSPYMITGLDIPSLTFGYCTFDFGSVSDANQFKGRFVRWLKNKDWATLCCVQAKQDKTIPTLLKLKETLHNGDMAHSSSKYDDSKKKKHKGPKTKNPNLTALQLRSSNTADPTFEEYWDYANTAWQENKLEEVSYTKFEAKRDLLILDRYDSFAEFHKNEPNVFQSIWHSTPNTLTFNELDNILTEKFPMDYGKLPNSKSKLMNQLWKKYPKGKGTKSPPESIKWMYWVKNVYCTELKYA